MKITVVDRETVWAKQIKKIEIGVSEIKALITQELRKQGCIIESEAIQFVIKSQHQSNEWEMNPYVSHKLDKVVVEIEIE